MKNKLIIHHSKRSSPDDEIKKKIPYSRLTTMYIKENKDSHILSPIDLKEFIANKVKELNIKTDNINSIVSRVESQLRFRYGFKLPLDDNKYGYVLNKHWNKYPEATRHSVITTIGLLSMLEEHSNSNFSANIQIKNIMFYPIPHPHIVYGDIVLSHGFLVTIVCTCKITDVFLKHINSIIIEGLKITNAELNNYIQHIVNKINI